jgi:hypothetical protein
MRLGAAAANGLDVYQTLVSRAQELARVGLALFGMARSLEQGQSKPAAEALDGILAQLLRVALDFLARTFGLDKLPKLLRLGLQALRRPVEKGVNWVLEKIIQLARKAWQAVKKGGAAAAQAGRQAVGAVKGFFGVRTEFDAGPEHHSLYFQKRNGSTVLIMESTPTEVNEFLVNLENHYPVGTSKRQEIQAVKDYLVTYQPTYQQLGSGTLSEAQRQLYYRLLLKKNVKLSGMLSKLLGKDEHATLDDMNKPKNLIHDENRYKLEGTTGIFANSLQTAGDELVFDHQPQAEVLRIAARLTVPSTASRPRQLLFDPAQGYTAMAERVSDEEVTKGYAILLSTPRHTQGRTFFGKGRSNALRFRKLTDAIIADPNTSDQQKRNAVGELLKAELKADAQVMIDLMQENLSKDEFDDFKLWGDIEGGWKLNKKSPAAPGVRDKFPSGKPADDPYRKEIKRRIARRIIQGEQELLAQPMDKLKSK